MTDTSWLVSSAGRRGHLVRLLQEASQRLGGGRVIAIDASPLSAACQMADAFEIVPPIASTEFIGTVHSICERYEIRIIVPTIDTELPRYAAARQGFELDGISVWVSSEDVIRLSQDKLLFYTWLMERGFDAPPMFPIRDTRAFSLGGPVIAKPRIGSSSIGLVHATDVGSLNVHALPADYILQSKASGYEVTVDFAVDRSGSVIGVSARRRLEVRAGEVSKAVTIRHERLLAEVRRLAASLSGAYGVLNVQVFVDDHTDTIAFIELNARFGGGYPLSWHAGAKFPLVLAGSADGELSESQPGVVMLRYDDAVFSSLHALGIK